MTKPPDWLPNEYVDFWDEPWNNKMRGARSKGYLECLDKHGYITPHFKWSEASGKHRNPAGSDVPASLKANARRVAWRLEKLRHELGDKPLGINSWYRNPAHNRAVGGASQSRHMQADAVDITVETVNRLGGRAKFDPIADHIFRDGGFGTYPGGNRHVDTRGTRARWSSF